MINLLCPCGNEFSVRYSSFRYNNQTKCEDCIKTAKGLIYNLETARNFVNQKSKGECKLLSKEYKNNKAKMELECKCGRIFHNSITNMKLNKVLQCNFCKMDTFRTSKEDIVKIAKDGNCEVLDIENYINEDSILHFKCACGEVFDQRFSVFKMCNKKCPSCVKESLSSWQRKNFNEVIKSIKGTKSELLSDESEYVNQYSNLRFRCPCGNEFKRMYINYIRREQICLNCTETSSIGERAVFEILSKNNVNFEIEYSFKNLLSRKGYPLRFDFAIFDNNKKLSCLIEYDGEFHYEPVISQEDFSKQKYNDNLKNKYCERYNIPLLRIPYFEFDNLENILKNFLHSYKLIPR